MVSPLRPLATVLGCLVVSACGVLLTTEPDGGPTERDSAAIEPDARAAPDAPSPVDAQAPDTADASDAAIDAPDASDAAIRPVTFAVIGDFGSGSSREAAVAAMVRGWSPDFVVTTGDNNYAGATDLASYDPNVGQFYAPFIAPYAGAYGAGAAENAFFPAIGNHDWDIGGGAPYFAFFTLPGNERYYEVARGPVRLVFLDSDAREPDGRSPSSVQGTWAQQAMAAAREPFVFVVFHHPAYTSSNREPAMLWPFKDWGADAVLTGHVHNYERLTDVGLTYFVNGQGGHSTHAFGATHPASQLRFNALDGAQLVTVTPSLATFRYFAVDGSLVDTWSIDPTGQPVP